MKLPFRALIGCEFSGVVCEAFNQIDGVRAWSCDYEPREDGKHESHINGDVLSAIRTTAPDGEPWSLIGLHYTCTFFCNSGVSWLYLPHADGRSGRSLAIDPVRWAKMVVAAQELAELWKAAIATGASVYFENPIMHRYALAEIEKALRDWHGPSPFSNMQTIQPYDFGHPETKATRLHLHKLQRLKATKIVRNEMALLPKKQASRSHYASPSPTRWKERSRTLLGIASAMAGQWASTILNHPK